MKSFYNRTILVGIAAAFLLGGCKKSNKNEMASMPPMEVDVAQAVEDSVMIYKDYPAHLRATSVVEIVARVDGTVTSKNYVSGDVVKKGQLLFTIEDTQYRNAVQQAQGQLDNAKSSYEYASKQYEAMKKAIEKDAVSQMEVIQSKSNYDESLASIKTAQANLQTAQTNLGYCRIYAPFDGRVTAAEVNIGGYVGGSVSPVTLATIYDNSSFYADFYIEDSTFIHIMGEKSNKVKPGYEKIPINFSEPLKHDYIGEFFYVAPDVDMGTGTLFIRARIDNYYDELRDGMYVTVSLPYQNNPHAILVEDAAIGTDQSGKYVYTVNENNEVSYTPIKVGSLVKGNMRVVTEGLKPGQQYVTKALLKVKNGTKVKPVLQK